MASADATTAALLLAFSAALALFLLLAAHAALLQPSPPPHLRGAVADLLLPALDRFLFLHLHARGILGLATRGNMILLCHAILLLILRDAGILGAPATATAAQGACSASPPPTPSALPHPHPGRAVVVWRRPRKSAAPLRDADRRVVVQQRQVPTAAALLTRGDEPVGVVDAKRMVALVDKEKPACNWDDDDCYLLTDDRDRAAAIVPVDEQPAETTAADDKRGSFDGRIIAVGHARRSTDTATAWEEQTAEMELADDRAFEEFIRSQRRKMRQESLQLVRLSGSQFLA